MEKITTIKELTKATGKHTTTISRTLTKANCPYAWQRGSGGAEKHFVIKQLPSELRVILAKYRTKKGKAKTPTNDDAQIGIQFLRQVCDQRARVRGR